MYCTKCGKELPAGAQFCIGCGERAKYFAQHYPKKDSLRAFAALGGALYLLLAFVSTRDLLYNMRNFAIYVASVGGFYIFLMFLTFAAYIFAAVLLFMGKRNNLLIIPYAVAAAANLTQMILNGRLGFIAGLAIAAHIAAIITILMREKINGNPVNTAIPAILLLIVSVLSLGQTLFLHLRYEYMSFGLLSSLIKIAIHNTYAVVAVYCVCKWCCVKSENALQ